MAPGCLRWWTSICKPAPGAPNLRCRLRGRGAGTSQRAPLMACAKGTCHLCRVWADAGRGHADAHVQRLPCSEVLQRRSPKDGFEKIFKGRESAHRAAQGYLRSTEQVARGCQRRCGALLVHCGPGGVSAAMNARYPQDAGVATRGCVEMMSEAKETY